ncbi:unnamed protein product [Schistocephalus solidus]|uniref:Uncharacterized protein n=1 Tax=Schistocephalus solidus TaxID=70667 RepID=A0A183TPH9_SCHSO|nr:unnamed protein product [Schistocephalus solidus]
MKFQRITTRMPAIKQLAHQSAVVIAEEGAVNCLQGVHEATGEMPKERVAAPSQLHLPQHGVDAEDSGTLQEFHVRDPVLPPQLQYSSEAAEMEVIQLPGLVRVDGPGLHSVKESRQDNGLVHLQIGEYCGDFTRRPAASRRPD